MPELERSELLKLYEIAIAEYRFQIQLNWDRSKHFVVFNGTLFGAAAAILKLGNSFTADVLVALLFLIAAANASSGAYVVRKGHEYYRRTRERIADLERLLGVAEVTSIVSPTPLREPLRINARLQTTPGMAEGTESRSGEGGVSSRIERGWLGRINNQIIALLIGIAIMALVACGLAANQAVQDWAKFHWGRSSEQRALTPGHAR